MSRRAWINIALATLALVGIFVAAGIKLLLDRPPAFGQPSAIRARFGEQLDILTDLARTSPTDGCTHEIDYEDLVAEVERLRPWFERLEDLKVRFDDEAILEAQVISFCGEATASFAVKGTDVFAWTLPLPLSDQEHPSVNLWYSGARRLVRYADRITGDDGQTREIRLLLDLELLGDAPAGHDEPASDD